MRRSLAVLSVVAVVVAMIVTQEVQPYPGAGNPHPPGNAVPSIP